MKKTPYTQALLITAAALTLTQKSEAFNFNVSGLNVNAATVAPASGDIITQNGSGVFEISSSALTIAGLQGTSGGQITSGYSATTSSTTTTLTLNVAAGSSYNYSGMWRPNNSDGSKVTLLNIVKNGEGSQEFSGSTTGYNTSYNTRPTLTVNAGTLIISGSIFHDLSGIGYLVSPNIVTVNGGTLEFRNNWDPWSAGNAFNNGSVGPNSETIMVNGGTLKFTNVTQNSARGFTVGNNGATLWADRTFTKFNDPNFNTQAGIAGSTGGNLTLTGSAAGCSVNDIIGDLGTWRAGATLVKSGTGAWTVQGVSLSGGINVTAGTLTINGGSNTAGNINVSGGTLNLGTASSAGTGRIVISGTGTVNASNSGFTNNVTIQGGTLNLNNLNVTSMISFSGGTFINANNFSGTIYVSGGALDAASGIKGTHTYASGARLIGNGTVGAVTLNSGAILAPGNSIGTVSMSSLAVRGGAIFNIEIQDPTRAAGVGYDKTNITGALDLTNLSSSNKATIKLFSLDGTGLAGDLANAISVNRNLALMSYGSLNLPAGTNLSDIFTIDTSSLTFNRGLAANGTLYNDSANNQLVLQLSPIPEPSTYGMVIGGLSLLAIGARRRQKKATVSA
jgi:autotransporter-associated beta strand protein